MASEPDGNRTVEEEDKTMIDRRNQSGGTVFVRIQTRRKLNYSETCAWGQPIPSVRNVVRVIY